MRAMYNAETGRGSDFMNQSLYLLSPEMAHMMPTYPLATIQPLLPVNLEMKVVKSVSSRKQKVVKMALLTMAAHTTM